MEGIGIDLCGACWDMALYDAVIPRLLVHGPSKLLCRCFYSDVGLIELGHDDSANRILDPAMPTTCHGETRVTREKRAGVELVPFRARSRRLATCIRPVRPSG